MTQCARLLLAGTHSGVGKTTLTAGLASALVRRGLKVVGFKVGPDYLDPTYLRAAGVATHNLDPWMMGRDAVLRTFLRETQGADVALVEGMMGLFDGSRFDSDQGSSAELARMLELPTVLVTDASALARSFAALVLGFASFDPALPLSGVIANRVGGRGHAAALQGLHLAAPWVGGVTAHPELSFPERHLGLEPAFSAETRASIQRWAEVLEAELDLEALLRIARSCAPLSGAAAGSTAGAAVGSTAKPSARCRLAIARDAAFCFYYAENIALLQAAGAELVWFSPLNDRLPDVDALYLGGGYPELFAAELAENAPGLASIRQHFTAGRPIYAECGGMLYACESLQGVDGESYPMLGLLPGKAHMSATLQAIGYAEVELSRPTCLGPRGARLYGHQFRYSTLEWRTEPPSCYQLFSPRGEGLGVEGFQCGSLLASYVHLHWGRTPEVAERLVRHWSQSRVAR